jgi:hypothetical protein
VREALSKAQSPRRFPFAVYPQLKKECQRLQHFKLIAKITELTQWVQQMAVVVKRDNSLRICLYPRELNKVVLQEHYVIPTPDDIFSQMHGAKYFSFLDATQCFHRRIIECLQGLEDFIVFVDDIAVWGGSKKEHNERLQMVLNRYLEERVNLNRNNCKFGVQEAKYLGHVLSSDGVKVNKDKVRAVKEIQKPQNREEVHRFLGMINF